MYIYYTAYVISILAHMSIGMGRDTCGMEWRSTLGRN